MIVRWPCRRATWLFYTKNGSTPIKASRGFSTSEARQSAVEPASARTRNIGIIAHIDAGKTTTTERMLYYSGFIRRLGDVDEGSTVTDFLPAERARGITIQSAAVTFTWPPAVPETTIKDTEALSVPRSTQPHSINLIDTPGHADFTFEVLRSLRVLDGAVCILDGVAGVEAQTEKVWAQASNYNIPRILFVNKLDREGAAYARTVKEIGTRLCTWPAVCQLPWWREDDASLQGVGDVIGLQGLSYERGGDGKAIKVSVLKTLEVEDAKLYEELRKARVALVELLSEHDDELVEKFFDYNEDHLAISRNDILESLRKVVLQSPQKVVPVFAGASFRNIGVQPLLDATVDLLPSPLERPDHEVKVNGCVIGLNELLSGKDLAPVALTKATQKASKVTASKATYNIKSLEACALAFKVVTDARRGVLVYVRVYSGAITRSAQLYNTNLGVTEKAPRLLRMYADDAVEVSSIPAGQIGVITGLKQARTGDTLIVYSGANPKLGPPAPLNTMQLRPIDVPPPVFFTSVEPNSLAEERTVQETLALLLREDPSLNVQQDLESGQTHLSGMGELHLEIARDRLINDLKAKARVGNIQIGYRETINVPASQQTATFDRDVASKTSKASSTASVAPVEDAPIADQMPALSLDLADNNRLDILTPTLDASGKAIDPEDASLPSDFPMRVLQQAIQNGVTAALSRGPGHGYPLHSTRVSVTFNPSEHLFPSSTPSALSSATRLAVTQALRTSHASSNTTMMEPVMLATISVDDASLGSVVHDLSSARGGQIVSLDSESEENDAFSPSAESDRTPIDPRRIYAPPDPFAGSGAAAAAGVDMIGTSTNQMRQIVARVPLKEMVGYLKHLRSLTAGRGTFVMSVDRFERMSAQRMKAALAEMRGDVF